MKCKDCEHFKVLYPPIKDGKFCYELGMAKCEKYDLRVDFRTRAKLNKLDCVEDDEITFAQVTGKPIVVGEDIQMTKEQILAIIDELKYNIKDGIGFPNCKRDFGEHEYEVAEGTLMMLEGMIEKWEAENDRLCYKYGKVCRHDSSYHCPNINGFVNCREQCALCESETRGNTNDR